MVSPRGQLLMLIVAVCSFHAMGFRLPPVVPPPTLQPTSPVTTEGPVTTDLPNLTDQPDAPTQTNPMVNDTSEPIGYQVSLSMDVPVPPIATRVKLGLFVVSQPGHFAVGGGLDLNQGVFVTPYKGIYYFSAIVHIKPFSSDTVDLTGSLAVGVCIDKACTEDLTDATLLATSPFHMNGFSIQASGLIQLEKCQSVRIILEHNCMRNFIINSSTSLSIYKLL